jgi:probable rRNA maturation factor
MTAIDIAVEDARWTAVPGLRSLCRQAVLAALGPEACRREVALLLADDARLRELNRRFRAIDKPTNVLAFPAGGGPLPEGPRPLGDVALAYETVAREAAEQGKALAAHLTHLVIHGVLHLLGHDHADDREAAAMEAVEVAVMARLGFADPYALDAP